MRFRKNLTHIKLTKTIIEAIRAEITRTCIWPAEFFKRVNDCPEKLDQYRVHQWLCAKLKTASATHLNFIFETYEAFPSNDMVSLSPAIIDKIRSEIKRTHISPEKFYDSVSNHPYGFTTNSIRNWLGSRVKKVRKSELDFVLNHYAAFSDQKINITSDMRKSLDQEIERTNVRSISQLIDHPEKPKSLVADKASDIIKSRVSDCDPVHWEFILNRYAAYPSVKIKILESNDLEEMSYHLKRAHVSYFEISDGLKIGRIRKYSSSYLRNLHEGKIPEISQHDWDEIVSYLKSLPDANIRIKDELDNKDRRIKISDAMRMQLNVELQRTGAKPRSLVRMCQAEISTLTEMKISRWKTGGTLSAYDQEWRYLMHVLRELPDLKR